MTGEKIEVHIKQGVIFISQIDEGFQNLHNFHFKDFFKGSLRQFFFSSQKFLTFKNFFHLNLQVQYPEDFIRDCSLNKKFYFE